MDSEPDAGDEKIPPGSAEWIDEVEFIIPPVLFHQQMQLFHRKNKIEFYHSGGYTNDSAWLTILLKKSSLQEI